MERPFRYNLSIAVGLFCGREQERRPQQFIHETIVNTNGIGIQKVTYN